MAEKSGNPYVFTNPLAQNLLNGLRDGTLTTEELGAHVFQILEDRMISPVRKDFKELYGVRNSAGQTFLYCLLRFTQSQLYRKKFLFSATADQLAMQNTNCGSTAIAGYFWGEIQRFCNHNTIRQQLDELLKQFGVDNFNRFMNIKNNNGESARNHADVMM